MFFPMWCYDFSQRSTEIILHNIPLKIQKFLLFLITYIWIFHNIEQLTGSSWFISSKDELTQYLNGLNVNNMAMKLRKAALKARHEKERNEMKNRLQKEIDQSINELKMTFDIKRMQAIEEQVVKE